MTDDGSTSDGGPRVSVAVSTHGRAPLLPRLVAALEDQTLAREEFEVVIVDDGSPDDTRAILDDLANRSPLRLRSIRLEHSGGPARGRNAAWRATRGEVIAFTDDDCLPTPTWLEAGLRAIDREPGVLVGATVPNPDHAHLVGPFSRTVRVRDAKWVQTCNAFYLRKDLEAVDGFDEGFPTPGGEDTDLAWRVRDRCARRIRFVEDALVYHDVRPSNFQAKIRETLRWEGIPRLLARHPAETRRVIHRRYFWKKSHPSAALAGIGLALALVFPPAVLLVLPWLRFRTVVQPKARSPLRRLAVLPGWLVIDLLEVYVMLRGTIRYRKVIL